MRIVLLGAPGAGKGTIAERLRQEFNLLHVSTGDLFRKNIDQQTELGKQAQSYMSRGELVPDQVTCSMVCKYLNESQNDNGFILDGFPRTCAQAKALAHFLEEAGTPLDAAILVDCPDHVVIARITSRRVCPNCGRSFNVVSMKPIKEGICDSCGCGLVQRSDDNPETVASRLKNFHEKTSPLIQYYQNMGKLLVFDNSGDFMINYARLQNELVSNALTRMTSGKIS